MNNTGYKEYTLKDVRDSADRKLFTVVSTFAGGGGSSTGYKLAGGNILAMNEFQQIACDTYSANYPATKIICKDIRELKVAEIFDAANLGPRDLDIFDGSPPCPPFSMSGSKRKGWNKTKKVYGKVQTNIEDLTFDLINLAKDVQSKVIVCENVKGLTMNYARDHMKKMIVGFESIGYTVVHRVCNASFHGVPQKRERVFIVCVRNDVVEKLGLSYISLAEKVFPVPYKLQPTQRDAIYSLLTDEENNAEGKILEEKMNQKFLGYLKNMAIEPDWLSPDEKVDLVYRRRWLTDRREHDENGVTPDAWRKEKLAENRDEEKIKNTQINYVSVGDYNPTYSGFQSRRLRWCEPSNTILEKGLMGQSHIHPERNRGYTTKEAIRLMGLPTDFILKGTLKEKLARIGLMVAPPQLKRIAETIYENILKPYKEIENV
jgi:DNA (cytosine-5)-methyltransferase 1